jgi:uroporphyrinogen III methyltransferase/synthase
MRGDDPGHERLPLHGQTVAVTRMPDQASVLTELLRAAGAEVIEAPTIQLAEPADYGPVDAALGQVQRYDWVILTSANGVDAMFARLKALGLSVDALAGLKVAAVGSATVTALVGHGVRPDLVPGEAVGEALAEALIREEMSGARVLLPRSDIARPDIVIALQTAGATCDDLAVYRTVCPESLPSEFVERLDAGRVDWLTLTSPSCMNNLLKLLGTERSKGLHRVRLASIGPVTTKAIRQAGFVETVEAVPHDARGLLAAMVDAVKRQGLETSKPQED